MPRFSPRSGLAKGQHVASGLSLLIVGLYAPVIFAQQAHTDTRHYAISAGSLSDVLASFASQSGTALAFDPQLFIGQRSLGLQGSYTPEQGFTHLLASSNYELHAIRPGHYTLRLRANKSPELDSPTTLPQIVVQSQTTLPELNQIEISADDLARINPITLRDVFQGQPSVQVGSSLPISQKLYVNGVEETNLLVTIDGNRQNNKVFHHNATNLIDPSLLHAVSIDAGVAPADAGPGALAGAVQFKTLRAIDLLDPGQRFGGFSKGEFNTNGSVWDRSVALYGKEAHWEYLGFVKRATGGLQEDGRGREINGSGTSLSSGLGKIAYESSGGHRVELNYENVTDDAARPYRANIGRIVGGRPTPEQRNYRLRRENIVLNYSQQASSPWWDPSASIAFGQTDLKIAETEQLSRGKTGSFNGKLQNKFQFSLGSITAGADFYADKAELDYRDHIRPRWNEAAVEKARNIGLFTQARVNLSEDLALSLGGRADRQSFTGVDLKKRHDTGYSGNISAQYQVTPALELSTGYSRVWAGIPLAENFILNPNWDYSETLHPVTANNAFVGVYAQLDQWLRGTWLKAKYLHTSIHHARAPNYRLGPQLNHQLTSRGVELSAGYQGERHYASIAYADIRSRIDGRAADSESGRYLTTPIGRNLTLEAGTHFPESGIRLGANAQITFKENDTYDVYTEKRGQALPGYKVVNAFVEYTPLAQPALMLRLDMRNILNTTYTSRATYGQEFDDVMPLREPGQSFLVSLRYRF